MTADKSRAGGKPRRYWPLPLLATFLGLAGLWAIHSGLPEIGVGESEGLKTFDLSLETIDVDLQRRLLQEIKAIGLKQLVAEKRLGVALVDLSQPEVIRYAGLNADVMMYAASLPKIAALLTAVEQLAQGRLSDSPELREDLTQMIRYSSNQAATRVIRTVGFDAIAACLEQDRYGLYDRDGAGGLWVGKAYDRAPAVMRDPVANQSHGATPRQAARFFVLLDRGLLVSPERSREMLEILGDPGIHHKFVKGLDQRPSAKIYRKSGSWRSFHSDAALIERNGHKYVAAALVNDPEGSEILERLIVALDDIVRAGT